MTPVSHALLPVVLGGRWLPRKSDGSPIIRSLLLVAACGVLPDVLSPHLSLAARHAAWSHTMWAFAVFGLLVALCRIFGRRRFSASTAWLCIAAYGGHLFCDGITGGVAPLYPIYSYTWGGNYLPHWLWITCDGALVIHTYFVVRWLPLRRSIRARRAAASSALHGACGSAID